MSPSSLRAVRFDDPDARLLVTELYTEQLTRYEWADPPVDDPDDYLPPSGTFVVLYVDGAPVGCGGYRAHAAGTGEIKRMYVRPAYRGCGYGRRILYRLEEHGRTTGATLIILETGVRNDAAIGLYESAGYTPAPSYAHRRDREINRAYRKTLHDHNSGTRAGHHHMTK